VSHMTAADSDLLIEKWLIVLDKIFRADKPARDDEFKDIYCSALRDLPAPAIEAAFTRCVRELKFYPTVSEVRERAPAANPKLLSEQAWEEVWRQVQKFGSYRKHFPEAPAFDAATEYALRQVGGYLYVCSVGVNDRGESPLTFIRRDFLQAFERFLNSGGAQLFLSQAQAAAELRQLAERGQLMAPAPQDSSQCGRGNSDASASIASSGHIRGSNESGARTAMTEEDWQRRISELRAQLPTTEGESAK